MTLLYGSIYINLFKYSTFALLMYSGIFDPTMGTYLVKPKPPTKRFEVYNSELSMLVCSAQKEKNLRPLVSRSIRWWLSVNSSSRVLTPRVR